MSLVKRVLPLKLSKVGAVLFMANTYIDDHHKAKYECRKWVIRSIRKPRRTKQEIACGFEYKVKVQVTNLVEGITYSKGNWNEKILSAYPEYIKTFDLSGDMPHDIWTTELGAVKSEIKYIKTEIEALKIAFIEDSESSIELEITEYELFLKALDNRLKKIKG